MKIIMVVVAAAATAGCVRGSEPTTSNETSALTQVNDTITWQPGKDCALAPCDGNHIWPAGQGITTVQVLFRACPDRAAHTIRTFCAFVVWNLNTVGRIYRIDVGAPGVDFREVLSNVLATRTWAVPDLQATSTGTANGGPTPPPHPNVDGQLHFSDPFLAAVKTDAAIIHDATADFLATPE